MKILLYVHIFCSMYSIDDDTWADKTDPKTGSVFHVEAESSGYTLSGVHLLHSNSSSSLSSNPSMTEIAPPSPTMSLQHFPDRYFGVVV